MTTAMTAMTLTSWGELSGWRRELGADAVRFTSPDGAPRCTILVRERLRPIRTLSAILRDLCAGEAVEQEVRERVLTDEGEYAALVHLLTARGGVRTRRSIGVVFADDYYAVVEVAGEGPAVSSLARVLVETFPLGLGPERARRFHYTPPAGWNVVERGLQAEWYAPGFPARHGVIDVPAARPVGWPAAADRAELVLRRDARIGFRAEGATTVVPLATDRGLRGSLARLRGTYADGALVHHDVATLTDGRFRYVLELEAGDDPLDTHRAAFAAMLESVEPLPAPRPAGDAAVMSFWAA